MRSGRCTIHERVRTSRDSRDRAFVATRAADYVSSPRSRTGSAR
jgi:hypothetical protein